MRAAPASEAFLRGPLWGVLALVVFAIGAAAAPRLLGIGGSQIPALEIATERNLYFWDRTDGGVGVRLAGARVVLLDAERRPVWTGAIETAPESSVALLPSGGREVPLAVAFADSMRHVRPGPRSSPRHAIAPSAPTTSAR